MSRIDPGILPSLYNRSAVQEVLNGIAQKINLLLAGYIYPPWGFQTVTSSYSVQDPDRLILINGDVTVTLPDARIYIGRVITCKAINSGTGTRTVTSVSGTIDGSASVSITIQYLSLDFVSDGTNWHIT